MRVCAWEGCGKEVVENCRQCCSTACYYRKYRQANHDKLCEQARLRRKARSEEKIEQERQRRRKHDELHPGKRLEYYRKYYAANRVELNRTRKTRCPEEARKRMRNWMKRRSLSNLVTLQTQLENLNEQRSEQDGGTV